jgi:hypothetical protein
MRLLTNIVCLPAPTKRIEAVDDKLKARVDRPHETPKRRAKYHVFKRGETALDIAAKYGLTWVELVEFNPQDPKSGDWGLIRKSERFRVG